MLMWDRQFVALECRLAPGGFSGEREFEVVLANGKPYRSLAPRQFCWNERGELVGEREPEHESPGMVAARLLDVTEDGQQIVEVPDGEVIAVDREVVRQRPTVIRPPGTHPRSSTRRQKVMRLPS
jgi:hypothetical protein